jgi:hypothetical protein
MTYENRRATSSNFSMLFRQKNFENEDESRKRRQSEVDDVRE